MRDFRRQLILFAVFIFCMLQTNFVYAQEAEPALGTAETETVESAENTEAAEKEPQPELTEEELAALKEKEEADKILNLEIKTSTLQELAQWCRDLGLSEGGSKENLMQRIRDHLKINIAQEEKPENQKVITIESARSTEYFTLKSVNEEYAKLSGGVVLSLNDGNAVHKIKAWEIIFNRTRNVLTATGSVEYNKEENDTRETFKGDSITINLDTWAGSFIDTISERTISGSETAYRFAGQVISKTDSDTTVLKKAHVTNAKSDEPYWSLDASRLWILPGSDWGLLNAVLKVGEIPVFWLPGFFFPADEVIFHPVLGTRMREGSFLQTTTYILGKADASAMSENSISKILGSGSGMEQVREGVFLRTTGKKDTKNDGKKFALLLDAYTNLGFYLGTEVALPSYKVLGAWNFSGGVAFTRTIHNPLEKYYTPYDNEEQVDWNKSIIFGKEIPLRYRMKTGLSVSGKHGSLTLDLPFYSDPFIDYDTMNRTESMDWMQMLMQGSATQTVEDVTPLGQYQWSLSGRPNISLKIFDPVVSNISISTISSVFNFNYKNNDEIMNNNPYSPQRTFFYPDKWTVFSWSGSIGGTPFSKSSSTSIAQKDKAVEDPLKDFGEPRAPWPETEKFTKQPNEQNFFGDGKYVLEPPSLAQTFNLANTNAFRVSLTYQLSPTMSTDLYFNTTDWKAQTDINLHDVRSMAMMMRTNGSTSLTFSEPNNNVFSVSGTISGDVYWQDHIYRDEEKYESTSAVESEKLNDYRSTLWSTNWSQTTQVNPFYWSPHWKTTNFQYTFGGLLAKSNFIGSADEPDWEVIKGKWTKEDLSSHRVSANIGVSVLEKMQNLTLYADLPPEESTFSVNGTARIWITETNANTIIKKPFESDTEFQPINMTETFNFATGINLKQNITYTPEFKEVTNLITTFNFSNAKFGTFNFSYNAARTTGYILAKNADESLITGWKQRGAEDAQLRSSNMSARYSVSFKKDNIWDKRLSFSISTGLGLTLDLQRYTYSKLSFNLSGTLKINKFLDFTMGTTSENESMFFYLSNLPVFDQEIADEIKNSGITYEGSFFRDLLNSFRFDDEDKRHQSGFKLKSFNFSMVHHLGDWNATLAVSMAPWRDTSNPNSNYKFVNNVAFTVQWLPVSEIKTDLAYDGREDIWTKK
ncbi:MAG: LPS-assembly protein LptD [Termitinemataceae bacterium]|nr:MAG: LPS-assembly protein LptD [Termitinemataceae bacterium]